VGLAGEVCGGVCVGGRWGARCGMAYGGVYVGGRVVLESAKLGGVHERWVGAGLAGDGMCGARREAGWG
jgi:hypothetical protein